MWGNTIENHVHEPLPMFLLGTPPIAGDVEPNNSSSPESRVQTQVPVWYMSCAIRYRCANYLHSQLDPALIWIYCQGLDLVFRRAKNHE
jgi:hypothetical protein